MERVTDMKRRQSESDPVRRPLRHERHKRPITRRDFLAQGFLTGAAAVFAPTLGGLLARPGVARAAIDCTLGGGGGGQIPFICFDLAGGANIAGSNVLVGRTAQLEELSAEGYSLLGLPRTLIPSGLPVGTAFADTSMGLAFHFDSAMLRGIKRMASQTTLDKVNGAVFCARSDNDTANNPHNPVYGINRAGANGGLLPLIGTRASDSGGNSIVDASFFDPSVRPTKVDRPSDVTGLVDTGRLVEMLGVDGAAAVMDSILGISDAKLARMAEEQVVADLVHCAYDQSAQLVVAYGDPSSLDPLRDPHIVPVANGDPNPPVPIFATAAEVANVSEYRKVASVMKLVVEGHAGAGTIEFGGYDYHDSTRATGERKDERAGEAIGAALEYAARKNQDLMIYVFSDGSVGSSGELDNSVDGRGKGIWRGDDSGTAAAFMLVYGRNGRPALSDPRRQQLGAFRSSGSVETAPGGALTQITNAPSLLAQSVVLNYLALHGRQGEFGALMSNGASMLTGNLDELIAFAAIR
jgi:hypothetical protein